MSFPITSSRSESLAGDPLRDATRSSTMSPPHATTVITTSDPPTLARSDVRSESKSCIHVFESPRVAFPVLNPEAINKVGEKGENANNGSQREVPDQISTYSRSKASASESEVLVFPLRATHLSEPTSKARNISSDPSTSHDSASADRQYSPSQIRPRVSGFSQNNSKLTRRPPLLGPLSPPKINPTAVTTTIQPGHNHPVPIPLPQRYSKSTDSQGPHSNELAHVSSAYLSREIPNPVNFKTTAGPCIPHNASTTPLGDSPTPINPEFRQIPTTSYTNWARTGLERRSSGSGPPPSLVHFPSRSRAGSYGESDHETLKARERRWGSGLPIPRPPSSRGSEESTKRTYSLDRPSSECSFRKIPSNGTNRRSSVSNSLSNSMRSSSCSRSRAASGGESDIEILKERERRWGSGLPIPKPPTPGKPESATKRRLSLEQRSTQKDIEHTSIEPIDKTDVKPNWATKMLRVEPVSKREIGDGSLTILNRSVLDTTFQQHPISAIAESPNISLHSTWANLTPFGPMASPLTASIIPGVGPLVEVDPDTLSPDGSLTSPDLPFSNEDGRTTGETFLHVSINMGDDAVLNGSLQPPSASLNETVIASPITITCEMSIPEVLEHLGRHGCNDVTSQIDISRSSEHPVSSGGFGDVYRGACHDGSQVAIKCLRLHADSTDLTKHSLKRAARELYVWSKCSHSNILTLIGVAQYRSQIAMVSPWMESGNLRRLLSLRPQVDRYMLCVQIADGLKYMHDNGIVHGDLKGDNILFADRFTPKLTDFGNAALKKYTLKFATSIGMAGVSPHWAAPEVVKEETSEPTFAADVWSLGMEAVTGKIPYAGLQTWNVILKIASYDLPTRPEKHLPAQIKHSDLLWSLLIECWAKNPGDRPNSIEVRDKMNAVISARDAGN